jgi:hypothetical protein
VYSILRERPDTFGSRLVPLRPAGFIQLPFDFYRVLTAGSCWTTFARRVSVRVGAQEASLHARGGGCRL